VALASRANDQGRRRVDSVAFQERSLQIVQEMRTLSTENSAEIRDAVEEGERRVARMVSLRRSPRPMSDAGERRAVAPGSGVKCPARGVA
jgi:hypothetical protein